jgi:ATP-dependent helicase/nuclease subunit A
MQLLILWILLLVCIATYTVYAGLMIMTKPEIVDKQQRLDALDISQSFLIQAPAGSGKTELLAQRYLKLLAHVNAPEEIVAITFTNKAAGEMQERIISALTKAAHWPMPTTPHEIHTWQLAKKTLEHAYNKDWSILENPNRLRIQTIDSFCLKLAQQLPISSNLGAPMPISDNAAAVYEQAALDTLLGVNSKDCPWKSATENLLLHLDNNFYKAQTMLVTMLAKRDQWLAMVMQQTGHNDLREKLENELVKVNEALLRSARYALPDEHIDELIELSCYAALNISPQQQSDISDLKEGFSPETSIDFKLQWQGLAELLLTQKQTLRKQANAKIGFPSSSSTKDKEEKALFKDYKDRFTQLLSNLESATLFIESLIQIQSAPAQKYTDDQWSVLQSLFTLLPVACAQLKVLFRQNNLVDYIENSQAALLALGDQQTPSELALALDYQIKHLLIDEFQDTSNNQFNLLERLTCGWGNNDGRSLFLVGDPMQSIYRFRDAEVGLFIHAKQFGIGQIQLQFLALKTNFRSTDTIVNWINQHFKEIFPKQDDSSVGAVSYNTSQALKPTTPQSKVHIQCIAGGDAHDEAGYICDEIIKLQNTNPRQSIAVLVRSRSHLTQILALCRQKNIAYQAIDIEGLAHKPMILDLLSLSKALTHLGDRTAWLACLRAPWCGLKLSDLLSITNTAEKHCLWATIEDLAAMESLSDDGNQRLSHFVRVIKNALQQRNRYSMRDWLEKTWIALGGQSYIQHAAELDDSQQFFKQVEELISQSCDFDIKQLERKMITLFATPNQTTINPVQIMTIHKSKGLEFDIVFLPGLHKKTMANDRNLLSWLEYPGQDNKHHLLIAPINQHNMPDSTYDYIHQQQQHKTVLELDRVLYVAATRAKENLYLTGLLNCNEGDELQAPSKQSLLYRFWQTAEEHIVKNCLYTNINQPQGHEAEHKLKRLKLENLSTTLPFPNDTYEATAKNQPELTANTAHFESALGSLIHLIIEKISAHGQSWWNELNHETVLLALMKQFSLHLSEHERAQKTIHLAISNLLADKRGQWIMKQKIQSELSLSYSNKGKLSQSVIDCTFIDNDGQRWIIDYKTSMPSPSETEKVFIDQQALLYKQQLFHYKKLMSGYSGDENIKLALYFPLLPAWIEVDQL